MAKPVTRLIRALLRVAGYDLARLQKTVVHAMDNERGQFLENLPVSDGDAPPRAVRTFDIIFRNCCRKEMNSPDRRRFFDARKQEIARVSLASLVDSVNRAADNCPDTDFSLTVLDNSSEPEVCDSMRAELSKAEFPACFEAVAATFLDNGPSMRANYAYGRKHGRDVVYFVEDDFLHDRIAVTEMVRAYESIAGRYGRDIVLFPVDNPGEYRHIHPSQVFFGGDRHWKRAWATTFSCVTTRDILDAYWENYDALGEYGVDPDIAEHNTVNLIYHDVPCMSPLPSLAVHMQMTEHLPPYGDWRNWWSRYTDVPLRPLNLD